MCRAIVGESRQAKTRIFCLGGLSSADDRGRRRRGRSRWGSSASSATSNPLEFAAAETVCGVLCSIRRPTAASSTTRVVDQGAHAAGALVVVAADLLALTLLKPPGEIRRGHRRRIDPALRRADGFRRPARRVHGTQDRARPQDARPHHRRLEGRATAIPRIAWRSRRASNTSAARKPRATSAPRRCCWRSWPACTRSITGRRGCGGSRSASHALTALLAAGLQQLGHDVGDAPFFDTLRVQTDRLCPATSIARGGPSPLDELPQLRRRQRSACRSTKRRRATTSNSSCNVSSRAAPASVCRNWPTSIIKRTLKGSRRFTSALFPQNFAVSHPSRLQPHHSETEMLRYIFKLQSRDLSLAQA